MVGVHAFLPVRLVRSVSSPGMVGDNFGNLIFLGIQDFFFCSSSVNLSCIDAFLPVRLARSVSSPGMVGETFGNFVFLGIHDFQECRTSVSFCSSSVIGVHYSGKVGKVR